jgi:DNA-binding HxlR family transcriptional regulator
VALPSDYAGQACSLARSLEVIGERWTLLVVRDAFYGVTRFNDFAAHLKMPRAVLTTRLTSLVDAGVLERVCVRTKRSEYLLTAKGLALWPILLSMTSWGDEFYAAAGPRRVFLHDIDGAPLGVGSVCTKCGQSVGPAAVVVAPGPGLGPVTKDCDIVTKTLARPRRLLTPIEPLTVN